MNANELADWFDGRILYLWDAEDGQYYDSAIADEIVPTLRNQQAEIEFLKKEILEKHEDWKHEGQQAANARAEIKALRAKLNADKFCDANCVWTDHHPDCQIGRAQEK